MCIGIENHQVIFWEVELSWSLLLYLCFFFMYICYVFIYASDFLDQTWVYLVRKLLKIKCQDWEGTRDINLVFLSLTYRKWGTKKVGAMFNATGLVKAEINPRSFPFSASYLSFTSALAIPERHCFVETLIKYFLKPLSSLKSNSALQWAHYHRRHYFRKHKAKHSLNIFCCCHSRILHCLTTPGQPEKGGLASVGSWRQWTSLKVYVSVCFSKRK